MGKGFLASMLSAPMGLLSSFVTSKPAADDSEQKLIEALDLEDITTFKGKFESLYLAKFELSEMDFFMSNTSDHLELRITSLCSGNLPISACLTHENYKNFSFLIALAKHPLDMIGDKHSPILKLEVIYNETCYTDYVHWSELKFFERCYRCEEGESWKTIYENIENRKYPSLDKRLVCQVPAKTTDDVQPSQDQNSPLPINKKRKSYAGGTKNFASTSSSYDQMKIKFNTHCFAVPKASCLRLPLYPEDFKNPFLTEYNIATLPDRSLYLQDGHNVAKYDLRLRAYIQEPLPLEQQSTLAAALLAMKHPNLLTFSGYCEISNSVYQAEEKSSESLLEYFSDGVSRLSYMHIEKIMTQVSKGMAYLHMQKLVHNNINVRSIFSKTASGFTKESLATSNGKFAIGDWRYATLAQNEPVNGIPTLMNYSVLSPERFAGSQTYADDVWSFGVLMCTLFMGFNPFKATNSTATRLNIINFAKHPLYSQQDNLRNFIIDFTYPANIRDWTDRVKKYLPYGITYELLILCLPLERDILGTIFSCLCSPKFRISAQCLAADRLWVVNSSQTQMGDYIERMQILKKLLNSEPIIKHVINVEPEDFNSQLWAMYEEVQREISEASVVFQSNKLRVFNWKEITASNSQLSKKMTLLLEHVGVDEEASNLTLHGWKTALYNGMRLRNEFDFIL